MLTSLRLVFSEDTKKRWGLRSMMASRLFFLGQTGLLDCLGEVLSSNFASGLDRFISSFHGSVVSMVAEVGSILVLSKLRIGFQVRMSFVYLPHSRRQNVDPKIYTKYLIVFEI